MAAAEPSRDGHALRALILTTKPPWPAIDGGRLLVKSTLEGLAARGHELHLVAPVSPGGAPAEEIAAALAGSCTLHLVPVRPRSYSGSFVRSPLLGRPLSIDRHYHAAVREKVDQLLAAGSWDVLHAEQLQAMAQAEPAFARGVPVVLRAQNVESELWTAAAGSRPWGVVGRWEAARLARWEGEAVAAAAATVALTERDADRLRELAGGRGQVSVVRAPFADALPPGERRLAGAPALVLLGSEGWPPNRDAVRFFSTAIWPEIHAALPAARLHVFGNWHRSLAAPGIEYSPPPEDSREVFAPGSIFVVPLRIASGVRMRILEAWARGVPVVASPQAAAGLDAEDGRDLLLARDGREFAAAIARLVAEPDLAVRLTAAGRATLRSRHEPAAAAASLEAVYLGVAGLGVSPVLLGAESGRPAPGCSAAGRSAARR